MVIICFEKYGDVILNYVICITLVVKRVGIFVWVLWKLCLSILNRKPIICLENREKEMMKRPDLLPIVCGVVIPPRITETNLVVSSLSSKT